MLTFMCKCWQSHASLKNVYQCVFRQHYWMLTTAFRELLELYYPMFAFQEKHPKLAGDHQNASDSHIMLMKCPPNVEKWPADLSGRKPATCCFTTWLWPVLLSFDSLPPPFCLDLFGSSSLIPLPHVLRASLFGVVQFAAVVKRSGL